MLIRSAPLLSIGGPSPKLVRAVNLKYAWPGGDEGGIFVIVFDE